MLFRDMEAEAKEVSDYLHGPAEKLPLREEQLHLPVWLPGVESAMPDSDTAVREYPMLPIPMCGHPLITAAEEADGTAAPEAMPSKNPMDAEEAEAADISEASAEEVCQAVSGAETVTQLLRAP